MVYIVINKRYITDNILQQYIKFIATIRPENHLVLHLETPLSINPHFRLFLGRVRKASNGEKQLRNARKERKIFPHSILIFRSCYGSRLLIWSSSFPALYFEVVLHCGFTPKKAESILMEFLSFYYVIFGAVENCNFMLHPRICETKLRLRF